MRRAIGRFLLLIALLATPGTAWADVTAFWGFSPTDGTRTARGFSFGLNLLVVGFEFEYANTAERETTAAPGVSTGMVNGVLMTPTPNTQLYFSTGGGFYRERFRDLRETGFGTNIGGGVKIALVGPVRLRLDYRIFSMRGTPVQRTAQRFYVGANLRF